MNDPHGDAGAATFTAGHDGAADDAGLLRRMTTSGGTVVVVPHASLGQLPAGGTTFAVGRAGPDGTLSAGAVAVIRQLPGGNSQLHVHLKNCSPASIDSALALGG
jgi:hypothetical protein